MCFHTELKKNPKKIKPFKVITKDDFVFEQKYHVSGFTYEKLPIITLEEDQYLLNEYNWGLIPFWCKDWQNGKKLRAMTLNARVETIQEKPSFRTSVKKNHCLIPITGFYEWHSIGKNKYPFYIYPKIDDFFLFAGIWDSWVNKETGEVFKTFSIITTEGNELMSKIHNSKKRMPVILNQKDAYIWLKNELNLNDIINQISVPFDEKQMAAHSISKLITSRKENSNVPKVSERYDYEVKEVMELLKG